MNYNDSIDSMFYNSILPCRKLGTSLTGNNNYMYQIQLQMAAYFHSPHNHMDTKISQV